MLLGRHSSSIWRLGPELPVRRVLLLRHCLGLLGLSLLSDHLSMKLRLGVCLCLERVSVLLMLHVRREPLRRELLLMLLQLLILLRRNLLSICKVDRRSLNVSLSFSITQRKTHPSHLPLRRLQVLRDQTSAALVVLCRFDRRLLRSPQLICRPQCGCNGRMSFFVRLRKSCSGRIHRHGPGADGVR